MWLVNSIFRGSWWDHYLPLIFVCQLMLDDTGNNLHETHDYGIFAWDASNMGYSPGDEIIASLLPVVTHMQKL